MRNCATGLAECTDLYYRTGGPPVEGQRPVSRQEALMISRPSHLWIRLALLLTIAAPAPALASGSGRLLRDVLPTFERLKLDLDARKLRYSGSASIDLRVTTAVDSFQLHSE